MRFVRYLLVQILAYALDMGGFVLLFTHFGIDPLVANMVSKMLAGGFAFAVHRSFTFGVLEASGKLQQGVRYFALLALNIPLSALVLSAMLWLIPMAVVAKFLSDVICVFLNYGLSKRFVFMAGDAAENQGGNERGSTMRIAVTGATGYIGQLFRSVLRDLPTTRCWRYPGVQ